MEVRTDEPEARFAAGSVLRTEPGATPSAARRRPGAVRSDSSPSSRPAGTRAGCSSPSRACYDRDVAEALRGTLLGVDSADVAPPEDPEEFHDHQLVGLAVVTPAGEPLGEVAAIDHAPASDLLVLRRARRRVPR